MASSCPHRTGPCIPRNARAFRSYGLFPTRGPVSRLRLVPPMVLLLAGIFFSPAPVSAQFGALEALASNVSDLSFFGGTGGLLPTASPMADGKRTFAFGVELLFEIATVDRPTPGYPEPSFQDSVGLTWTRMEVVRSPEGVDSIFHYEVGRPRPTPVPMDTIWTVEMGIGYGQISGYDLLDPALELRGSVRDLPAATVYASYEPWSVYFGIRTGFMRTKSLQVVERETGEVFAGNAEAFLLGGLVGYAWSIGDFWAFAETAYTIRSFPSVEWSGGPLPDQVPRDLQLSGWSLATGIQFPIR